MEPAGFFVWRFRPGFLCPFVRAFVQAPGFARKKADFAKFLLGESRC
ncbi:hypothetical protein B4109_2852 [Geobacillus stearothermophilus]|uniref:Uncharacterized protein n=1 Tax=Geobacillus stearothermophilus TaxID=1422 RepID=A0A150MJ81_GEOSE|nr:hypothetical protein B4109_2852 [Geobacillus stearothermophilus]